MSRSTARSVAFGAGALALAALVAFLLVVRDRPAADSGKIRVLFIEERPRWEYRYLKNQLCRDEGLEVQCHLLSADRRFEQETSPGVAVLEWLPETRTELSKFDVVIVGDLSSDFFDRRPAWAQLLAHHVRRGGGLITVAGARFDPPAALAEAMPVELDPADMQPPPPVAAISPWLTAAGSRHDLMQLAGDPDETRALWEQTLPALYWCRGDARARPGSTVLATRPVGSRPDEPAPLIVLGRFGKGRSLFVGTDELWRWRTTRAGGGSSYARFWTQAIRHVSRSRRSARAPSPERPSAERAEPEDRGIR